MISILLASYNGEKFIAEQIESLLAQTFKDFKLYIYDDMSTDSTVSILQSYEKKHPKQIYVTLNKENTGGAKHNFIRMMIEHKDDYVMLCDQDDVWLPNKINKTLNEMKHIETIYGSDTPILVHSDLKIVDKSLHTLSNSFMKSMYANYKKSALRNIVIQNTLTGCTAMYNRALARLIQEEPQYMVMHDWWLILITSAFGKVSSILEPLILYRQHDKNEIGANKVLSVKHLYHKITHFKEMDIAIRQTCKQANSFLIMYNDKLTQEQKKLLTDYASIPIISVIDRLRVIFRHRTFKNGFLRKLAQIIVLILMGTKGSMRS